jgi:hypothetical protein
MEKVNAVMPLELPSRKYYNIPIKTKNIPIIQKPKDDSALKEQFDSSSSPNSPPNDFLKFLKQRIEQY